MLIKIITFIVLTFLSVRSLYFYQLKEYRFDRLYDFFKYDKGIRTVFSIPQIVGYVLILTNLALNSNLLWTLALICLSGHLVLSFIKFRFLRPAITLKSIQLLMFQIILVGYFVFNFNSESILLAPVSLLGLVIAYMPITKLLKELTIAKAKAKLKKHPNLIIIGITGSYGKSSVKEFLTQALSFNQKFNVLKTPKNINTDIGVAKVILNSLQPTHQVMVVEMGAYKIGEIANIVKMMPLDFAVITAMAPQHLSLFGSLQNIQIAKSEIATGLSVEGKLYLNLDSEGIADVVGNFEHSKVIGYGSDSKNPLQLQISQVTEDLAKGNINFKLNQESFQATTLPAHNAINLAPVIDIAMRLGLSLAELKMALLNLKPDDNNFKIIQTEKYTILDDSYNSNVVGFKSAINLAKKMPAPQKVLITMGMIELGELTSSLHKEVAAEAGFFDYIILTRSELKPYFEFVITPDKLFIAETPDQIIEILTSKLNPKALILVENRLNPKVFKFLKQ